MHLQCFKTVLALHQFNNIFSFFPLLIHLHAVVFQHFHHLADFERVKRTFNRFTQNTPSGAPAPTLRDNPFIGPNPVLRLTPGAPADPTPPITITNGSYSRSGSFLFDTGADLSPLENTPPRTGHDPHDDTPKIPAAQALKDTFWHPDGWVDDVCSGAPCTGPQF